MITACKSYITEHGYKTVWDYQQEELIAKLKNCIRLNEEYQRCFQKTKQRLEENPEERQFEFSEMYIFGKINTFARRLHKTIEMLDTMKAFSCLGESRIEGMEQLWNKFVLIVTTMRKKPYDLLDYRKMDFDADFEEFKRQINDLQVPCPVFWQSKGFCPCNLNPAFVSSYSKRWLKFLFSLFLVKLLVVRKNSTRERGQKSLNVYKFWER